jgi:uroporphyrinogen decarboxylase
LTSRERVLRAINHREPDRVPVDLGGLPQSGIAASTYHKLKQRLGLHTPTRVTDLIDMLAEVEQPVRERLGVDVVRVLRPETNPGIGYRMENWKPWTLFDGTPVEVPGDFNPVLEPGGGYAMMRDGTPIARMIKDDSYFNRVGRSAGAAHVDVEKFQPAPIGNRDLEFMQAQAEWLHGNTEYALVCSCGPQPSLFTGLGGGDFAGWCMTLSTEPDYAHALLEKAVDAWIGNLKLVAAALGDKVQILHLTDDFGTHESLLLSARMFRSLIMPHYKRGLDWIHQNTQMKVLLHSNGAVFPLIPSLIEMGVDILHPVQITAKGMDPARLKETYGSQIVFWGGAVDCQRTLPLGTPEEVAREVETNVKILGAGGGYVCGAVHNIQPGVPAENVFALFDAARSTSIL